MAGTYTHLSVVRSIYGNPGRISAIPALTEDLKFILRMRSSFVDLGAVSPDCPFLYIANYSKEANSWGNLMHYHRTADFIREGIDRLMHRDLSQQDTQVAIAWLFGYTSHLVTDLTVHPVVEIKVGDYANNKKKHKFCELQQDAYIFNRVLGLNISEAEYIKGAGFKTCTNGLGDSSLHRAVEVLWSDCISTIKETCRAKTYAYHIPKNIPRPSDWFGWFVAMIDKGAEEGHNFPLVYHLLRKFGLSYPANQKDIEYDYVLNLEVPGEARMDFSQVFDIAIANVSNYWGELSLALHRKSPELFSLVNGNLDTGIADGTREMIFWR